MCVCVSVLQKSVVLFMDLNLLFISCFSAFLITPAPGVFYVTLKLNTCRGDILTKTSMSETPVISEVRNFFLVSPIFSVLPHFPFQTLAL